MSSVRSKSLYDDADIYGLIYKTTSGAADAYKDVRFWFTNTVLNREPTLGIRHATHNHAYAVISIREHHQHLSSGLSMLSHPFIEFGLLVERRHRWIRLPRGVVAAMIVLNI